MKQLIIGNMTGNSMDAIDLVLTEFDGNHMNDICTYSKSYDKKSQVDIEYLRNSVYNKTVEEIIKIPRFKEIHDNYVKAIADCILEMLSKNNINKSKVNAIGFHGKTLDHYPPSLAITEKRKPYTLQIGSGKMLADLTNIPVVYDFRSAYIINGFEGAPLASVHNAHISKSEGDGCYYNGGNTANFAFITNGQVTLSSDVGPFNEYIDNFIRLNTTDYFDENGKYGLDGKILPQLLQSLFNICRCFYEKPLPKSGDPQYYFKNIVFDEIKEKYPFKDINSTFKNIVHTLEYFSAYIAVYSLALCSSDIKIPNSYILFGGGWKNPVVFRAFTDLINRKGYILDEHKDLFNTLYQRLEGVPQIKYSNLGNYMEARLFADMARYKLENKVWELPEVIKSKKNIVSGVIALPNTSKDYDDMCCLAAKGWG